MFPTFIQLEAFLRFCFFYVKFTLKGWSYAKRQEIIERQHELQSLGFRNHIGFVCPLRIAHQTEKGFKRTFGRMRRHICEAKFFPQHQIMVRERPDRRR